MSSHKSCVEVKLTMSQKMTILKISESVSLSCVQLFATPWKRLLCPRDSPGKVTGVGCYSFLQGIFLTQGSNPGLLHCRQIRYPVSHQGRTSHRRDGPLIPFPALVSPWRSVGGGTKSSKLLIMAGDQHPSRNPPSHRIRTKGAPNADIT